METKEDKVEIRIKFSTIIITLIILMLVLGGAIWYVFSNKDQVVDNPNIADNTGLVDEEEEEIEDIKHTWILEPELDFDKIYYIPSQDTYMGYKGAEGPFWLDITDAERGIITEREEMRGMGSGAGGGIVVYDEENKIWGTQNYDEGRVETHSNIAMARDDANNYTDVGEFFPVLSMMFSEEIEEEYSSNRQFGYAYANEIRIVTEFVFDGIDGISNTNTPAVSQNGKWGFINEYGEIIIPFEFDGAVSINDELAFVKLNGKWGIISKAL